MNINKEQQACLLQEQLVKIAATDAKEKRGKAYMKVSNLKCELNLEKLCSADNLSEFEELYNSIRS